MKRCLGAFLAGGAGRSNTKPSTSWPASDDLEVSGCQYWNKHSREDSSVTGQGIIKGRRRRVFEGHATAPGVGVENTPFSPPTCSRPQNRIRVSYLCFLLSFQSQRMIKSNQNTHARPMQTQNPQRRRCMQYLRRFEQVSRLPRPGATRAPSTALLARLSRISPPQLPFPASSQHANGR